MSDSRALVLANGLIADSILDTGIGPTNNAFTRSLQSQIDNIVELGHKLKDNQNPGKYE